MAPKNFNHPALVKSMADTMVQAWPEVNTHLSKMTEAGVDEPSAERCFYGGITWCIEFVKNLVDQAKLAPKNMPGIQAALHEASRKLAKGGDDVASPPATSFDSHELSIDEKDGEVYYSLSLGAADSALNSVTLRREAAVAAAKAILFDHNRRTMPRTA